MNYSDPKRPLSNGFPMLQIEGRQLVMPQLFLGPQTGGRSVSVTAFMPNSLGEQRRYYALTDDLNKFWVSWMEDPEQTLQKLFNYKYYISREEEKAAAPKYGVASSLSDLGLDD